MSIEPWIEEEDIQDEEDLAEEEEEEDEDDFEEDDQDDEVDLEEGEADGASEDDSDADDGDLVVSFGDEEPEEETASAPEWVKELRVRYREESRRAKELERELEQLRQPNKAEVPGKKPQLEDFDYDSDQYEEALASWFEKKREADEEEERIEQAQKAAQKAWNDQLAGYEEKKAELKAPDIEDAESTAREFLSDIQQSIIISGADNSAKVIYALGKNPSKAKELAAITDPVKFSFAVAKLEERIKVGTRKPKTNPEKTVSGAGSKAAAVDSTLERLRADAEKTGDYTKVMEYKRNKKRA